MGICGDIAGLQAADGKVGAVGAPCPQHACTQGQPRHTDGHTQRANTLWSLEALTCKYRLVGGGTQLVSLPITTWSPRIGLAFLTEDPTASLGLWPSRSLERLLPRPQGAWFGWLAPRGPAAAITGAPPQSHTRQVSWPRGRRRLPSWPRIPGGGCGQPGQLWPLQGWPYAGQPAAATRWCQGTTQVG